MTWLEMSIESIQKATDVMGCAKPAKLYLPILPGDIKDDRAFAVFDNPYMQRYDKAMFDRTKMGHTLIVGRAGSGKSELMHTLAERFNEDTSVYIIDHGGGRLKDQSQKSCCGGYISEDESDDIERLMIFIEEELSARRRRSGCKTREKSPVILVADGLESVEKASEEFREHLIRILTAGKAENISVIAASCEIPAGKVSRLFDTYLFLGDEDPYTVSQYLKVSPRDIPQVMYMPGRGVGLIEDMPLEFQAVRSPDHSGKSPPGCVRAVKFPHVPPKATLEIMMGSLTDEIVCKRGIIPVGYEQKSGKIYGFPIGVVKTVLIFGRTFCGRHTLLFNISITAARYGITCTYVQSYEALISTLRKSEEKKIVTIESVTQILDDFYSKGRSGAEEEELAGFLSNPVVANKNDKNESLIIGIIDNEAKMRFAGRKVFEEMCRHIYGLSLGGKLDENRVFDYSYLPYSRMQKSQSRGYATVLKYDENLFFGDIIFPVEI